MELNTSVLLNRDGSNSFAGVCLQVRLMFIAEMVSKFICYPSANHPKCRGAFIVGLKLMALEIAQVRMVMVYSRDV